MADYYTKVVFQPLIPNHLLTGADKKFLRELDIEFEKNRSDSFLFAMDWNSDYEDDIFSTLQEIICRSKGELIWISMEISYLCSAMRPDGFGGEAAFITSGDIRRISTNGWISDQIKSVL